MELANAALVTMNERRLSETVAGDNVFALASLVIDGFVTVLLSFFLSELSKAGAKAYRRLFLLHADVQLKQVTQRDVSTVMFFESIDSALHVLSHKLH
jgi:hypothetical protein